MFYFAIMLAVELFVLVTLIRAPSRGYLDMRHGTLYRHQRPVAFWLAYAAIAAGALYFLPVKVLAPLLRQALAG